MNTKSNSKLFSNRLEGFKFIQIRFSSLHGFEYEKCITLTTVADFQKTRSYLDTFNMFQYPAIHKNSAE